MSTIRANAFLDNSGGNTATINGITPALASQAQAEAGTDNTTLVTPLRVDQAIMSYLNVVGSAPLYACRAWVSFNGTGTVAIRASGNVSSITDVSIGRYAVNFSTAMSDANYATVVSARGVDSATERWATLDPLSVAQTTSIVYVLGRSSTSLEDMPVFNVAVFR